MNFNRGWQTLIILFSLAFLIILVIVVTLDNSRVTNLSGYVSDNISMPDSPKCKDSDGGVFIKKEGFVNASVLFAGTLRWYASYDICGDDDKHRTYEVLEYYCNETTGTVRSQWFDCPYNCANGACVNVASSPDIASYWKFDENTLNGLTGEIKDVRGIANLSTYNGAVNGQSGIEGNSVVFDGINDYVSGIYNLSYSSFTLSFWFNTKDAKSIKRIIEHSWQAYPVDSGVFTTHIDNNTLYTGVTLNNGSQPFIAVPRVLSENKWYHYVLTYNGAAVNIYINGTFKKTMRLPLPLKKTTKNLYIGGAPPVVTFNGSIDEFIIYSRALNESEIGRIYNAQVNAASLGETDVTLPPQATTSQPSSDITVSQCQILDISGKKYVLNQSIVASSSQQPCLNISADNIVLDGANFFVRSNNQGAGVGIAVFGRKNVTIKNINLLRFNVSILFEGVNKSSIKMSTLDSNKYGVLIINGANNTLESNEIYDHEKDGVRLISSTGSKVSENIIVYNGGYGIALVKSSGNQISDNLLLYNNLGSTFIDATSSNNTFEDNDESPNEEEQSQNAIVHVLNATELKAGASRLLAQNDSIKFISNGRSYSITLTSVNNGNASFLLVPSGGAFTLSAKQSKSIDMTRDGTPDILVEAQNIASSVKLFIQAFEKSPENTLPQLAQNASASRQDNGSSVVKAKNSSSNLKNISADADESGRNAVLYILWFVLGGATLLVIIALIFILWKNQEK